MEAWIQRKIGPINFDLVGTLLYCTLLLFFQQTADVAVSTQISPSVSNSSADGQKTKFVDQKSAQWTAAAAPASSIQNDYNHMTEDEQLTQALALSLEGEASVPGLTTNTFFLCAFCIYSLLIYLDENENQSIHSFL